MLLLLFIFIQQTCITQRFVIFCRFFNTFDVRSPTAQWPMWINAYIYIKEKYYVTQCLYCTHMHKTNRCQHMAPNTLYHVKRKRFLFGFSRYSFLSAKISSSNDDKKLQHMLRLCEVHSAANWDFANICSACFHTIGNRACTPYAYSSAGCEYIWCNESWNANKTKQSKKLQTVEPNKREFLKNSLNEAAKQNMRGIRNLNVWPVKLNCSFFACILVRFGFYSSCYLTCNGLVPFVLKIWSLFDWNSLKSPFHLHTDILHLF